MNNMDCKSLMISDWVSYCNEYFQVDYYHRATDTIGLKYKGKSPNFQDGMICSEDAIPIPLTEEILKANGFKAEYAPEDYRYDDKMMLTQSYDKQGYWWVVGNMYVVQLFYVHELQHALKLCGLNEMADNFKVEE